MKKAILGALALFLLAGSAGLLADFQHWKSEKIEIISKKYKNIKNWTLDNNNRSTVIGLGLAVSIPLATIAGSKLIKSIPESTQEAIASHASTGTSAVANTVYNTCAWGAKTGFSVLKYIFWPDSISSVPQAADMYKVGRLPLSTLVSVVPATLGLGSYAYDYAQQNEANRCGKKIEALFEDHTLSGQVARYAFEGTRGVITACTVGTVFKNWRNFRNAESSMAATNVESFDVLAGQLTRDNEKLTQEIKTLNSQLYASKDQCAFLRKDNRTLSQGLQGKMKQLNQSIKDNATLAHALDKATE